MSLKQEVFDTEKSQVFITELRFFEIWRLELTNYDFKKTSHYTSVKVFRKNGKTFLEKDLLNIPLPSNGIILIYYSDGSVIQSESYLIKKMPTKQKQGVMFSIQVDFDLDDFIILPQKGTLTVKDREKRPLFTLILEKLLEPNSIHYGNGELYVYCPKKLKFIK